MSDHRLKLVRSAAIEVGKAVDDLAPELALLALQRVMGAVIARAYPAACRRDVLRTVTDTLPKVVAHCEALGEVVTVETLQ